MTVDEFLGRVTSREISDWAAFFQLEQEELEKQRKDSERGQRASEGKRETLGAADAITRARQAQGLE